MSINDIQVQERCYKELFGLKGDNSVDLVDMDDLPYCQATILEIQRLGTIAPSSLIHKTLAPVLLDPPVVRPTGP